MDLPIATQWFVTADDGDDIVRLTEPAARGLIRSNVYVVTSAGQSLVIDTGCGIVPLRPYLPPMRSEPAVVATHGHFDHVGGFHEFEVRMIHQAEAAAVAEPDPLATLMPARSPALIDLFGTFGATAPEYLIKARPTADFDAQRYVRVPAPPTRVLADADLIDVGDRRLEVVHLPGHSPGSICLYERDTATLFSGDVIYDDDIIDDVLPGTDRGQYVDSMRRIMEMDIRRVLPGHGGPLNGEVARNIAAGYLARRGASSA